MFDILSLIPGKRKLTSSGWYSFNAVCCSHHGHRSDKRMRGGIKFDGQNSWNYHCFNCGFRCGFKLGKQISYKTRQLLIYLGVDIEQIQRWGLESLQHKDILDLVIPHKSFNISFKEFKIPEEAELLDIYNTKHDRFLTYLLGRGIDPRSYPFYVTPNMSGRYKDRIIVPYTYNNKVVGMTSRFLDDLTPKYINEQQQGYVFGIDFQKTDWQVCIVTEGIFDALSIDGCALMHDDISNEQAYVLSRLNKQIIVVPDFDRSGLKITDRALELGYSVSLPNFGNGIKDINDAVNTYGKLPTLLSILESATNSRIKIELRKKQIGKRL